MFEGKKTYVMVNKINGARIECTEKFLAKWLSLGFEVEKILLPTSVQEELQKRKEQKDSD